MTLASECIVAGELGLPSAAVCVVDNLANGIAAQPLSPAELERDRERNATRSRATASPPALPRAGAMTPGGHGATLDGETVGLRCVDGTIAAIGPEVAAQPGDETIDAARDAARARPGQRPHPRGDDAVPRLRRRPAADALAGGEGLAGRGEAGGRGRLLGHAARLRRDDPHRHRPLLGHVLAAGGDRAGGRGRRPAGDDRRAAVRRRRPHRGDEGAGVAESRRWPARPADRAALAPHSIYTVSEELLRWAGEHAAERGLALQIHLSETEREVADCLAAHGDARRYLDRLGLLGERTVLAHGVWLDEAELELIAERGATVVANPVANMKLAVGGVMPYPAARQAGVAVGLGTDGAGSNDSLDLLADSRSSPCSAHAERRPDRPPGRRGAGDRPAPARRCSAAAEPLSAGAPADFLLLRGDSPELGIGDLASDLVYAASGSVVDTTVVAGRVLMRGGEVEGVEEIVARARREPSGWV